MPFRTALALCLAATTLATAAESGDIFIARAYCMTGVTADGHHTVRGVLAADPRVLPLGTKVYISRAGRYTGVYTVHDTGSAIKGRRLDVYIPSYSEAIKFGVKRVRVTVLKPFPAPPVLPVIPPNALPGMDGALLAGLVQPFPEP